MKLSKIKEIVDNLVNSGYGDYNTVITTHDISIGARAYSDIQYISNGFDWESGQIRIEPQTDLISKSKDRDKELPIIKHIYGQGIRNVISCPKCENHLRKDDRYCSNCGQRVNTTKIAREINHNDRNMKIL